MAWLTALVASFRVCEVRIEPHSPSFVHDVVFMSFPLCMLLGFKFGVFCDVIGICGLGGIPSFMLLKLFSRFRDCRIKFQWFLG